MTDAPANLLGVFVGTFVFDLALADLLAPLAIVIAAVVAARYARNNHEQQLGHDRALRQREAETRVLDDVLETHAIGMAAYLDDSSYSGQLARANEKLDSPGLTQAQQEHLRTTRDYWKDEVTEVKRRVLKAMQASMAALARLEVTFGPDHSISQTYSAWDQALRDLFSTGSKSGRTGEESEELLRLRKTRAKFLEACGQWSRGKPGDEPPDEAR